MIKSDIISPAVSTPKKINKSDFLGFIPNNTAIRLPVQAPVPGSGMATKRNKPR